MMTRFLKSYFPAISIAFTFIVCYGAVSNYIQGNDKDGFVYFIIEIMGYLIISIVIDYLVSLINFKKFLYHFITETILLYPLTIIFAIWGYWVETTLFNLIWYSMLYVLIMIVIHYYFYFLTKKQADEINKLLKGR